MSFDLTGQFISDTYGRVVQYVSGALYDGLGNPVTVVVSGSISTGSFATTGSNTFIGDQTISGSIIIQNTTPYALAYFDITSSLRTLPSPVTSSGDTIAIFVSGSNSWVMTNIIDGGSF
jgi:hypothetical protein